MPLPVLLLATLETKIDEASYLARSMKALGLSVEIIDASLGSKGAQWPAERKLAAMRDRVAAILKEIGPNIESRASVVIGIGGGTGGEIILRTMRDLSLEFPKVMVTTLPFDPRAAVADNSIILVPSLADIEGLNPSLRRVLDRSANLVAGLAQAPHFITPIQKSVALTTLGVTRAAGENINARLKVNGLETTAFHANGFGGAAFARFCREGAFLGVIDMTVHEMTRMAIAGLNADMPDRFTIAGDLPRVVLPGGLNFLGFGEKSLVAEKFLKRPHYQHSSLFTHVEMSAGEMEHVCIRLADALNLSTAGTTLLLPMGGFSSEDRPGGAIENKKLREIAADILTVRADAYQVEQIDAHILDSATADRAVELFLLHCQQDQTP